jgi:hypothetical protein
MFKEFLQSIPPTKIKIKIKKLKLFLFSGFYLK